MAPHLPFCTAPTAGLRRSSLVCASLALLAVLALASCASAANVCDACVNEDTRNFLKYIATSIPALQSEWGNGLSGDYCAGLAGIDCSDSDGLITLQASDMGLAGSFAELPANVNPRWVRVKNVHAQGNELEGTLPGSWASLTMLTTLDLAGNGFCGCVPRSWETSPVLQVTLSNMGTNGQQLMAADCAIANRCGANTDSAAGADSTAGADSAAGAVSFRSKVAVAVAMSAAAAGVFA